MASIFIKGLYERMMATRQHVDPNYSLKLSDGWLSKLWSLFWILIIMHLIFRVPQKGP